MSYVKGLKCKEADCGRTYPQAPHHICEYCFGKLEVDYDYEAIGSAVSREVIEERPANMWRYREFLPIDGEPIVGVDVGFTPLQRAHNLEQIAPGEVLEFVLKEGEQMRNVPRSIKDDGHRIEDVRQEEDRYHLLVRKRQ